MSQPTSTSQPGWMQRTQRLVEPQALHGREVELLQRAVEARVASRRSSRGSARSIVPRFHSSGLRRSRGRRRERGVRIGAMAIAAPACGRPADEPSSTPRALLGRATARSRAARGRRAAVNPATGRPFAEVTLLDARAGGRGRGRGAAPPSRPGRPLASRARARSCCALRDLVLERGRRDRRPHRARAGQARGGGPPGRDVPGPGGARSTSPLTRRTLLREDAVESHVARSSPTRTAGSSTRPSAWSSSSRPGTTRSRSRSDRRGHRPDRRQHRRAQARARHHPRRPAHRRALPRGGRSRRRRERGGRGRRGRRRRWCEDPRVAKIVFTGSVATGKQGDGGGGEEPHAGGARAGRQGRGGRVPRRRPRPRRPRRSCGARSSTPARPARPWSACTSSEPVAEAFMAKVVEETRRLRVGDPGAGRGGRGPADPGAPAARSSRSTSPDAVAAGRAGPRRAARAPEGPGCFYPPTVLADVDHTHAHHARGDLRPRAARSWPWPPWTRPSAWPTTATYGLTASGWTRDPETARRLQRELQRGGGDHQRLRLQLRRAHRALGRRQAERHRPHPRPGRPAGDGAGQVRRRASSAAGRSSGGIPTAPELHRFMADREPRPPRARPLAAAARTRSRLLGFAPLLAARRSLRALARARRQAVLAEPCRSPAPSSPRAKRPQVAPHHDRRRPSSWWRWP